MIDLVAHAKDRGGDVTSEVNPFALFLSDLDAISHLGPFALGRCIPRDWVDALYEAIRDGTIDVLGSDHAPHSIAEKEIGWENMWKAPSGTPQLQHYLPRLLTETKTGRLTIEDVVRITATNPARRFGLYPKKGVLAVGSDADMAIVNMTDPILIRNAEVLSRAGYTPYHGERLIGVPKFTTVRGQVVAAEGVVTVSPGYGDFTPPVGPPESSAELRARSTPLPSAEAGSRRP
jgi:dihydroorotase-like cyclic amidohydrolase